MHHIVRHSLRDPSLHLPRFCKIWTFLSSLQVFRCIHCFRIRLVPLSPPDWLVLTVAGILCQCSAEQQRCDCCDSHWVGQDPNSIPVCSVHPEAESRLKELGSRWLVVESSSHNAYLTFIRHAPISRHRPAIWEQVLPCADYVDGGPDLGVRRAGSSHSHQYGGSSQRQVSGSLLSAWGNSNRPGTEVSPEPGQGRPHLWPFRRRGAPRLGRALGEHTPPAPQEHPQHQGVHVQRRSNLHHDSDYHAWGTDQGHWNDW